MSICIGVASITGAVVTAAIGSITPDDLKTYIGFNYSPIEQSQFQFEEPMGSFGIEYDVYKRFRLFAEHISSPMQCTDHPGINHAGIKLLTPINNDLTVYSGISVNNSSFDSNDNFNGPLGSVGIEYGKDLKFFAEHLANVKKFAEGRTSLGFKVFFK